MIELRWLKGNWEFGKFKLQYRQCLENSAFIFPDTDWVDVPMAKDKPKEKTLEEKFREYLNKGLEVGFPPNTIELARIAKQHFKDKQCYLNPK